MALTGLFSTTPDSSHIILQCDPPTIPCYLEEEHSANAIMWREDHLVNAVVCREKVGKPHCIALGNVNQGPGDHGPDHHETDALSNHRVNADEQAGQEKLPQITVAVSPKL